MPAQVTIRWRGAAFAAKVRRGLADNLEAAADRLRDDIKKDISVHGSNSPPVHSKPGDPPLLITGDLLRSYFAFTDRKALMAEIGSPLVYAGFLELGTARMAPRPHIRRNLFANPAVRVTLLRRIP